MVDAIEYLSVLEGNILDNTLHTLRVFGTDCTALGVFARTREQNSSGARRVSTSRCVKRAQNTKKKRAHDAHTFKKNPNG